MNKKIIFVTGISGQDGSIIADSCIKDGSKVYGMIRRSSTNNTSNIKHLLNESNFELVDGDMCDEISLNKLINTIKPHEIYNLAGQSDVAISFDQPLITSEINYLGVIRILEAIRNSGFNSKFYQAGSSEMFGNDNSQTYELKALNENSPMNPVSPYAISKLAAYHVVRQYRKSYNMFACTGILFNHESERRGEKFVTMKICNGFKRIIANNNSIKQCPTSELKIHLGNIEAKRDWGYAKDYVEVMKLMLSNHTIVDYVIGTGVTRSIKEFIQTCIDILGLDGTIEDYITIDPKFYRPIDINILCADPSKAKRELGWEPTTSFENMVRKMLGVKEKISNNVVELNFEQSNWTFDSSRTNVIN